VIAIALADASDAFTHDSKTCGHGRTYKARRPNIHLAETVLSIAPKAKNTTKQLEPSATNAFVLSPAIF
jgi:hypothetical protein